MTREGWRVLVVEAVRRADVGDNQRLDLLSQLLEEQDEAKQILRDAGIGCTGLGIKETAKEASDRIDSLYHTLQYEE